MARKKARPEDVATALDEIKRATTTQLLFRVARLVNERALARAGARFGMTLKPSHTTLFPHIDLEGTRQTELARRLGITKQAVNQLVSELEALGILERAPDPDDGRATLVRFTERGVRSLFEGLTVLGEIDAELEGVIGRARMRTLHQALSELDAWASG